ncbi:hypothetical protein E3_0190 [Rhodococcus phage E3]|uniref:hypothetical protein n=1 Tax=Rhodococcus phage E3 TaxID=1007869 RepID=UPI0002C6BC75|nr:hypothetical protein M176_gp020 [Rhodococcus phage E3]AEQ20930.1 hypothetical protein E3_0190 [Rhodococcus phage E3]
MSPTIRLLEKQAQELREAGPSAYAAQMRLPYELAVFELEASAREQSARLRAAQGGSDPMIEVPIDPLWPGAVAHGKLALAKEQCSWPPPKLEYETYRLADGRLELVPDWDGWLCYGGGAAYLLPENFFRDPLGVDHLLAHQRGMRMR